MPQRLEKRQTRLDTTVSQQSLERIAELAAAIERSGRRYQVSRTEVIELAIDWMFALETKGRLPPQPVRDERNDVRTAFKIGHGTMAKLKSLAKVMEGSTGYVHPPRARPGASLGESIDWCVDSFHGTMVKRKGAKREKAKL